MRLKEGDYVKVIRRECTPADIKNKTYYPFFGGLAGTVDKVYDKEICIKVDPETVPQDMLKRHLDIQDSIKRKWLNGLSGEARNRLTPEEKRFQLAYTILVQADDLEKASPGKPASDVKAVPIKPVEKQSETKAAAPRKLTEAVKVEVEEEPENNGLTSAERAFLKEREERLKGGS